MKRAFLLAGLPFFLMFQIGLSDSESAHLYNRANEYYTSKEYHKALDLYIEVVERGVKNPSLYYNLANTYFKIGKTGKAVLYYEKALILKPFDREIRSNLKYVGRTLEDKIKPLYDEGFFRFFRIVSSFIKLKITVYAELIFFTVFIVLLFLFLFMPAIRPKLGKPVTVSAVLFFLAFIGMLSHRSYVYRHPRGIILEKVLDAKSSPIVESETTFTLHEGTKIKLIEQRGDWIRFTIADGRQGWILLNSIALIEPD